MNFKNSDNISVLLGNGDGTFGSPTTYTVGDRPSSLVVSDLNQDGTKDIVTANSFSQDISILYGNGDGTFAAAQTLDTGVAPFEVAVADLNSDGALDLFSYGSSGDSRFSVLLASTADGIAPLEEFSLATRSGAIQVIETLDSRREGLTAQRGLIGSFQSRIQSALNTLSATSENYAAAESRIRDADIAFESSQLTRLNILQQAAAAVLGQANLQPSLALTLLQ